MYPRFLEIWTGESSDDQDDRSICARDFFYRCGVKYEVWVDIVERSDTRVMSPMQFFAYVASEPSELSLLKSSMRGSGGTHPADQLDSFINQGVRLLWFNVCNDHYEGKCVDMNAYGFSGAILRSGRKLRSWSQNYLLVDEFFLDPQRLHEENVVH